MQAFGFFGSIWEIWTFSSHCKFYKLPIKRITEQVKHQCKKTRMSPGLSVVNLGWFVSVGCSVFGMRLCC